jgi:hypothetical protein
MLLNSNNGGMMYKIIFLSITFFFLTSSINALAEVKHQSEQNQSPVQKNADLSQDFYKTTVQAYKDFNEQAVKYVTIALTVVSALVTGLVILFVFVFRKTLAEIRKDIKDDADRINDVYSKTFELLNRQADTNLRIFESRETELKEKIKEAKEITEGIKDLFTKMSDKEEIREPIAEELINKEFEGVQKESTEIKKEMDTIKEDLKNLPTEE